MKKKRHYQRTAALLGAQPHIRYAPAWQRHQQVHIPWKLALPLVVVLTIALWLWLDNRWYLMGEQIQITGASTTSVAREVALASDLLGWHSFLLRPKAAAVRIMEQVPGVIEAQATCYRFPAECTIAVVERTPTLVWATGAVTYWADLDGKLFPAQGERPDLPLVRGPLPDNLEDNVISANILEGMDALIALGIPANQFEYNPKRGLIWTDTEGRRIAFGTGADMEARWAIYHTLIAHLESKNVFPWAVDVRFPKGPTYSLERTW
jgi:cell division septal protein FtsQ